MHSLSFDYLFNRVYDVLLWIKYTWLFTIMRTNPETYVQEVAYRDWDGLRDRGWFEEYFANINAAVPEANVSHSLWQRMLESIGLKVRDSDFDGIPDVTDSSPYDKNNLTTSELKERYEGDYSFLDHIRDAFGIGPKDTDKDGVPDSYETNHAMDPINPDSDRDGALDSQELIQGTDPVNSDTDGDLVLDGRDEAPLSRDISSIGKDTDSDGVSDIIEGHLGSNITLEDTDQDNISDRMDTYPLDPENIGQFAAVDFSKGGEGLQLSIQNPVLVLFTDMVSILVIIVLCIFVYVIMRWLIVFFQGFAHYEHHFHHSKDSKHGHGVHTIKDTQKTHTTSDHIEMPAGIAGLPVGTSTVIAPTLQDMTDHPKFAVIQGYMSSQSEALWRIGIMEADNVLLEILAEKGYPGDGVGEKLKSASFKTVDLAWDAHKIRNRIAHEGSNFELTEREAKRAFMLYESVLRDLKAIR